MARPLVASALVAVPLTTGCSYGVPPIEVPAHLPPLGAIDRAASQVVVTDLREDLDPEDAEEVREEIAEILGEAIGPPAEHGAALRFYAQVSMLSGTFTGNNSDGSVWLLLGTPVLVVPLGAPLGLNIEYDEVAVNLVMDIGGDRFAGEGRAASWGSIYAPARHRALAKAVQIALLDARSPSSGSL
ncbi:MAG: hypothetical protein AAF715_24890 [Myxococcota bacterium]